MTHIFQVLRILEKIKLWGFRRCKTVCHSVRALVEDRLAPRLYPQTAFPRFTCKLDQHKDGLVLPAKRGLVPDGLLFHCENCYKHQPEKRKDKTVDISDTEEFNCATIWPAGAALG